MTFQEGPTNGLNWPVASPLCKESGHIADSKSKSLLVREKGNRVEEKSKLIHGSGSGIYTPKQRGS